MWDDISTGEISNGNGNGRTLQLQRSKTWNYSRNLQWRELTALKRRSFGKKLQSEIETTAQNTNMPQPHVVDAVTSEEEESGNPKKREKQKRQRQRKAREIHTEALHNTRDTITLVAMLVATFTYNAGVHPPGGVHQDSDNPLIGTAVAAQKTAFRVFWVCNNVALFVSICIVLVMVSVIPFSRKALMRIMSMAHRAVWVAVSFMASAYVAAQFAIMHPPPRLRSLRWTSVFLLSVCSSSLVAVSVAVGIMWIRHRFIKIRWREQNPRRRNRQQYSSRHKVEEFISQLTAEVDESKLGDDGDNYSDEDDDLTSEDSDVASSRGRGYHPY